jgi:hypothetical protein
VGCFFEPVLDSAGRPDTWTWNGTDWTQQHPRHHPSARTANGLAYDPATGSVVLFGGELALPFGNVSGETWTWDGRDWKQQHGHESPSPRRLPGMVTDPATCSVVLFGGDIPNPDFTIPPTNLGDTWVYASSPGASDTFDQHAATQHEHGSSNCSPTKD